MARRLVHISDLHFGRVNAEALDALIVALAELRPDLIVVSGDLTQRARTRQFRQARAFLDGLRAPVVVVPGNHDIPLWDVTRRFLAPLRRYRRVLERNPEPAWQDDELLVVGLCSPRPHLWKEGRLSREQLARTRELIEASGPDRWKIVVVHHPFFAAEGGDPHDVIGNRDEALRILQDAGCDAVLAGHLHRSWSRSTPEVHRIANRALLAVQAGSAISTRLRSERNSFNVLDLGEQGVLVAIHELDPGRRAFVRRLATRYVQRGTWQRLDEPAPVP